MLLEFYTLRKTESFPPTIMEVCNKRKKNTVCIYLFKATQLNCNFQFFVSPFFGVFFLQNKDITTKQILFFFCEIKMKIESEILHFFFLDFLVIFFFFLFCVKPPPYYVFLFIYIFQQMLITQFYSIYDYTQIDLMPKKNYYL